MRKEPLCHHDNFTYIHLHQERLDVNFYKKGYAMDMSMHMEPINLVKSLRGTYKQSDKEMVVRVLNEYKEKNDCSYKHAYDKMVDGNPSFSTTTLWRRKLTPQ